MPWSDDVRLLTHPFRVYRALGERERARPEREALRAAGGKAMVLLLVIGGFVSLTTAGRLVAFHVVSTMLFWSFVPLIQAAVVAAVLRLVAPEVSLPRALSLYFDGHAPWTLFLLLLAGACLVAPDVYGLLIRLLGYGILPGALVLTALSGGVLTYACFRAGIDLPRRRAGLATLLFYLGYVGAIVGYYLVTNQIQPQLSWWPT